MFKVITFKHSLILFWGAYLCVSTSYAYGVQKRVGIIFLEAKVTGVCELPNMGVGIQTLDLIIEQQVFFTANPSLQICFY